MKAHHREPPHAHVAGCVAHAPGIGWGRYGGPSRFNARDRRSMQSCGRHRAGACGARLRVRLIADGERHATFAHLPCDGCPGHDARTTSRTRHPVFTHSTHSTMQDSNESRPPGVRLLKGILPIRRGAVRDVFAGISLASMDIPQVLGYARIAGMPAVTGLYTVFLPLVAFACFGASRHLVVAADSATATIFASRLSSMAPAGSAEYVALAGMVALLTAAMLLCTPLQARLSPISCRARYWSAFSPASACRCRSRCSATCSGWPCRTRRRAAWHSSTTSSRISSTRTGRRSRSRRSSSSRFSRASGSCRACRCR